MTSTRGSNIWLSLIVLLALTLTACSKLATMAAPPGSTPVPPTAAPTQAPPTLDPSIFYQDSFTDPASGWPTNAVGTSQSGYHPPDAFHIEIGAPDSLFWAFREQDFGDFSAQAQFYVDSLGNEGQWRHGLGFRQAAEGQFYAFMLNPRAQTWHVLKRAGDVWQTLAEGGNASIVSEPKAVNTLRVDAQGPNFTFSVNGQPAVALGESDFPVGDFGFVAETFDQSLAHIHFESIVVRRYDPSQIPAAPTAAPTPGEATPAETTTPVPTMRVPTAAPTLPPAAAAATAAAAVQTAAAVPSIIPSLPTLPTCGLPGLPACPP